ncbi:MAG: flagellar M-ring protein FliF [Firmicutes bacterium]|nr:flagellar M-ring protein FliF [Bacillota bacterium]
MATGMQTGRRPTGAAPARTGTAPAKGPGGGLGNVMQKWNDLDGKVKTIVIVSIAVLVCVGIGFNLYAGANKMVQLYPTTVSSADVQAMQTKLAQMGIKHEVAEGGTNILVLPKDKSRTIMVLASQGLPSRPLVVTPAGGKEEGGLTPPTGDEKERKYLQQQTGDLVVTIRQIEGVADAYLKIVPKPKNAWQEEKGQSTASVLLRLSPGAKLNKGQINGIVSLIAYSIEGLDPKNIKVMDTTGKILNGDMDSEGTVASGEGGYTDKQLEQKKAEEVRLQGKVKESLSKIFGGMDDKYDVQVSVEMDNSQKEVNTESYGGPGNTDGRISTGEQVEKETYKDGGSDSGSKTNGAATMSSGGGEKGSNYIKLKTVKKYQVDSVKTKKIMLTPEIKKISCSVAVDGVKDPAMIEKIKNITETAIGFNSSRGDQVAVESMAFIRNAAMSPSGVSIGEGDSLTPVAQNQNTAMAPWMWSVVAVPVVLLLVVIALFYVKQQNVQKEKQRLVLTAGPGATVSDISDLLADKEGKVTTPPATKVNTTEQLEALAKEKPTKVAELLKSTWLSER